MRAQYLYRQQKWYENFKRQTSIPSWTKNKAEIVVQDSQKTNIYTIIDNNQADTAAKITQALNIQHLEKPENTRMQPLVDKLYSLIDSLQPANFVTLAHRTTSEETPA